MPASTTTTVRFDHSNCKHARTGAEGKKARATCRKAHAAEAAKATTKKPASPRTKRAVKKPAATVSVSVPDVADVDDSDI